MSTISKLLMAYRKHHQYTQQDLVNLLSSYTDIFTNLNTVTISRWETDKTTPSILKKQKLLHFFNDQGCITSKDECYTILHNVYRELYDPLADVFTRNYQYLIGNFPEFPIDASNIHTLRDYVNIEEHIEHIIDIETVTNVPSYYSVNMPTFKELCTHPSSFTIVCERKKQHLGHFVMFKVKTNVATEIVHHRRSEYSLTKNDLCAPEEKGTYYVHAMFGKNPKIAALLNVYAYLYLLEHMQTIENVMIFASRKDGVLLTKDYGIKLIAKGIDETYGFEWHGMMSPVEEILFSETVVKCIF